MATKTRKELEAENQARYNAATSGSQSISDYLASNGVKSDGSYTDSNSGKYYTTVTESNGSKSNGYIKDGVSYYSNGTPINAGASVTDSTGKTWTKGGTTTSTVEDNPYQDQIDYYKQAYQDLEDQIREQNRLAVEQGTNRLNAQKSNINQAADENARQAYVQYMQSQKALPQQLASQGVSGGATETANLGIQTAYQNNVNAINQNKTNRLQEIDNAIVDLQNTGDLSLVEQVLANNQAALDAYTSTFDKGVSYNQWANQFNANRQDTLADQAYRDQVYKDQMIQQELENEWYKESYKDAKTKDETNRVITLLENGIYNPETASALLGVPTSQLQEFVDYIKKARNLELSNTQSLINNRNDSGNPKAPSKTDVFNNALAMLKTDGWTADDVMKFVWGQGLSEADEMDVLSNLGLLNSNTPVENSSNNSVTYTSPTTLNSLLNSVNLSTPKLSTNNTTKSTSVSPMQYLKGVSEQAKENDELFLKTLLNNLKNSK